MLTCTLHLAQECKQVRLWGSVKDTTAQRGLYNLMIVNKTTGRGVFGKPDGSFSIYVSPMDSIYFSVSGYKTIIAKVVPDSTCSFELQAFLDLKEYKKNETVVYPIKSVAQLKEERERLAQVETRTVQGMQVIESPITALYEQFSHRGRMKRKLAELQYHDQIHLVVKEMLRNYVSYDIIDLTEEEFDAFINFLDLNDDFLKNASDYELILFIKEKYIHFRQIHDPGYIYNEQNEGVEQESQGNDLPITTPEEELPEEE
jgi:hypothetical protein